MFMSDVHIDSICSDKIQVFRLALMRPICTTNFDDDEGIRVYIIQADISTAPYKHHLAKMGDVDRGSYNNHFQNWQFDVSIFWKKVYLFPNFSKIHL